MTAFIRFCRFNMGIFWFLSMLAVYFDSVAGEVQVLGHHNHQYTCKGEEHVYFVSNTTSSSIAILARPATKVYPLWTENESVVGVGAPVFAGATFSEAGLLPVLVTSHNRLAALFGYVCSKGTRVHSSHRGWFVNATNMNCVDRLGGWGEPKDIQQEFDPQISYARLEGVKSLGSCCYMALRNVYRNQTIGKLRLGMYENRVTTAFFTGFVDNEVTTNNHFGMGLIVLKWDENIEEWLVQGPKNEKLCKVVACEIGPDDQDAYPAFISLRVVQSFYIPGIDLVDVALGSCGLGPIVAGLARLAAHPQ